MKKIALYIHIPFCKQKCLYCDFPSYSHKEELMDKYIEALNKEILEKTKEYKIEIERIFINNDTDNKSMLIKVKDEEKVEEEKVEEKNMWQLFTDLFKKGK